MPRCQSDEKDPKSFSHSGLDLNFANRSDFCEIRTHEMNCLVICSKAFYFANGKFVDTAYDLGPGDS